MFHNVAMQPTLHKRLHNSAALEEARRSRLGRLQPLRRGGGGRAKPREDSLVGSDLGERYHWPKLQIDVNNPKIEVQAAGGGPRWGGVARFVDLFATGCVVKRGVTGGVVMKGSLLATPFDQLAGRPMHVAKI